MSDVRKYLDSAIRSMDISGADSCSAGFLIGAEFPGFDGHFEGNPVLPGVCYIQLVLFLAEKWLGVDILLKEVLVGKFLAVVVPDTELTIVCRQKLSKDGDLLIKAVINSAEKAVAKIDMKVEMI
ncbi:MAG: hypothetical protein KAI74_05255 [Kiritimatiellae bacterium]|nr:hypothetical protein [Kiritimatiellia bacterium]